jgi:hypothetical protein
VRGAGLEATPPAGSLARQPAVVTFDGDLLDLDAALCGRLLHVTTWQAEAQVPADGGDDHVGREQHEGGGFSCRQPRCWIVVTASATAPLSAQAMGVLVVDFFTWTPCSRNGCPCDSCSGWQSQGSIVPPEP